MKVEILREQGYNEALFGTGLSFGLTSGYPHIRQFEENWIDKEAEDVYARMERVGKKLAPLDGGHNKFLEMITVWLDIDAPRYWWSEFDTYRCGMTKLSESTIHTITKNFLTQEDFEGEIPDAWISYINDVIDTGDMRRVKQLLPEAFLQRRIVCTNYKTLKNIYHQRKNHRLPEWHYFCKVLKNDLRNFEFIDTATSNEEGK